MEIDIVLDAEPPEATEALERAVTAHPATRDGLLRETVTKWPGCLEAWALLGSDSYDRGDYVSSYAFCRVGYHRGLDRMRQSGWRGTQTLSWDHAENRGFLSSLHGLMRSAAAIGEGVEARRCRDFLLQLDPRDHFGVEAIKPAQLSRRLEEGSVL
ncbi:MAG TPA: DUF3151 family protein [Actinomycetota bacterium]|nr:DUF3151 family protein [Actinomycetota bacterium]